MDELYRRRAAPAGSARYWSLQFTSPAAREALLGIYALTAEWRALYAADIETAVATTKLAWWADEVVRIAAGGAVHPIGRHLRSLPGAERVDFAPLSAALEAAALQMGGVPVERGADLDAHAAALIGAPLAVAAELVAAATHDPAAWRAQLRAATAALGAAEYRARAAADYAREARRGRMLLPIDELLAAGIDNADLAAPEPPSRLREYLERLRRVAAERYRAVPAALPTVLHGAQRGLLVLADLGLAHLEGGRRSDAPEVRLRDMFRAWRTARRALAAR
jgi:phytoene synthase